MTITQRIETGVVHILYGLWSFFVAFVEAVALLLTWIGRVLEDLWRYHVWPTLRDGIPVVVSGIVNVSLISVNAVNVTLATIIEEIRRRL